MTDIKKAAREGGSDQNTHYQFSSSLARGKAFSYNGTTGAARKSIDRRSLPAPLQYLSERGLLKSNPRGEWAAITCPAHKGGSEKHASLGVNMIDGHFRCHSCGVKGGDIVALHRLITGLGFLDAVRDLGGRFHD